MTVKELKKFIENVPNDAIVVVPGANHEYHIADIEPITAIFYPDGEIFDDIGQTDGVRKFVLVVE